MRASTEIRTELDKAQSDKDAVKSQIEDAASYAAETGEYSDSDWFLRAKNADRAIGRRIRKLMDELSASLKEERRAAGEVGLSFERVFMVKAREILPRTLYEQIMLETVEAEKSQEAK